MIPSEIFELQNIVLPLVTPPTKRVFPQQTNADRIRAMSDEELAAWLVEDSWDCHDCPEHERLSDNPLLRYDRCDEKCVGHCLDWLRQVAKDGDNA